MSQTVTISSKTVEEILANLNTLTREIKEIKARLFGEKFTYGSNEWWDKEIEESEKEFKKGKGTIISNKKELTQFFQNL